MPLSPLGLLPRTKAVRIELLGPHGGDDTDFVVRVVVATRVHNGVNVELRGGGLAGLLAKALDELLLEVVGDVVLLAEEDDAPLGDCANVSRCKWSRQRTRTYW